MKAGGRERSTVRKREDEGEKQKEEHRVKHTGGCKEGKALKPGSLCQGPCLCARRAIEKGYSIFPGNPQERKGRSQALLAHLMQLLDGRHLSMVKKTQRSISVEHLVRMNLQVLARTGRWINDSPHVLYGCEDTFLLLLLLLCFPPQFMVLFLYSFYSLLLVWELHILSDLIFCCALHCSQPVR